MNADDCLTMNSNNKTSEMNCMPTQKDDKMAMMKKVILIDEVIIITLKVCDLTEFPHPLTQ